VLASPSPTVERKSMEDNDSVEPTDPLDPIVPDAVLRDIAEMGEKRKSAWVR
jgi:hypothetical protein